VSGDYLAMVQYEWNSDTNRRKADFRILVNGTQVGEVASIESKDVGNSCYESFFKKMPLSGGTHEITLQYKKNDGSYTYTVSIYDAAYWLQRIGVE
jgi:hypothetical protein